MSSDILTHLLKAKISPCDEGGSIEIDRHNDVLNTRRSYFFDCLKFDDGSEIHNVFVTLDRQGECDVDFNEIEFAGTVGLDAEAIVEQFRRLLVDALRSFLDDRGDLA